MKKIFILCIIILTLGCSSDKNDRNQSDSIVGKWYYKEIIVNADLVIPYDDHEDCGKDYIQFGADGSFRIIDVWDCEEDPMGEGTYTLEGNILTFFDGPESLQTILLEKTPHALKYNYEFDYDNDGTIDSVTETYFR